MEKAAFLKILLNLLNLSIKTQFELKKKHRGETFNGHLK